MTRHVRPRPFYVIIRGPLGAGKSTLSSALAKSIGAIVVSIDAIADKNWDGGTLRLYLSANVVAATQALRALVRGTPAVFDGCFYWKTQIEDLEKRLSFAHAVFTLKAPLSVCIERDAAREVSFGPVATEKVFRKVSRFEYGIPIDVTKAIPSVLREMRSHLPPR